MKTSRRFSFLLTAIIGIMIMFGACEKEDSQTQLNEFEKEGTLKAGNGAASYIIVLNDDFEAAGELSSTSGYDDRKVVMTGYLNRFLNGNGVGNDQVDNVYSNVFMGFSARLSPPQLERLQNDPRVNYIEADQTITLGKPSKPDPNPPSQTKPRELPVLGVVAHTTEVGKHGLLTQELIMTIRILM